LKAIEINFYANWAEISAVTERQRQQWNILQKRGEFGRAKIKRNKNYHPAQHGWNE
jgi:hypothetical protein